MDHFRITALSLLLWATANTFPVASFQPSSSTSTFGHRYVKHSSVSTTTLFLTPLPKDISPFDKTASKGRDIQGDLRKLATTAFENALCDNQNDNKPLLLELEFPPLIGGEQSKTQFDDFDSKTKTRHQLHCRATVVRVLTTLVSFFFSQLKTSRNSIRIKIGVFNGCRPSQTSIGTRAKKKTFGSFCQIPKK